MIETKAIEELGGRELAGRLLEIWEGRSGLSVAVEEAYRNLWRKEAGQAPKIEPCRFIGEWEGETIVCEPCGGRVKFKVFPCSHPNTSGRAVLADRPDSTVTSCLDCSWKNRDPIPPTLIQLGTPRDEVETVLKRLRNDPPHATGEVDSDLLREAHLVLLREAVQSPPPVRRGEGRGVVMGVGGTVYFGCAYVTTSVLRARGCTLPVEWWHLGLSEIDPTMRRLAADLGVVCVDALEVASRLDRKPRILNGWELKPFSVAHSSFREVLYLDADSVPAQDPSFLFDHPLVQKHGAAFWPDLPPYDRAEWTPEVVWKNVGLEKRDEVDFESGQFLIDKSRCEKELGVTVHLNDYSDWYYRFVYGDKTTYHLAWRVCGRDYAIPRQAAGWIHPAIQQHDFDGRVLFQHVCQGKEALVNGTVRGLHDEHLVKTAAARLKKVWHGKIWSVVDCDEIETQLTREAAGTYSYKRLEIEDEPTRTLDLRSDGTIGEGAAACERAWCVRILDNTPTLVITGSAHKNTQIAMMFLTEDADGVWRGRWQAHERAPVELRRLT